MSQESSDITHEFDSRVDRFDAMWHRGAVPQIEDFLPPQGSAVLDPQQRRDLLAELIMIDLEFRWRRGGAELTEPDKARSDREGLAQRGFRSSPGWKTTSSDTPKSGHWTSCRRS